MKTLWSSSSKLFTGGKNENRGGFLLSVKDVHVLGRTEVCFLGNHHKHVSVGLIALQHKKNKMMMIRPVFSPSSLSNSSLSSESQAESKAAETRTQKIHQAKTVHVKLQLQKECLFGENFLIVGDDPMFGLWDPLDAIPLEWSEEHIWAVELDIPIGRTIQFKFILKENTGNILWQPGPDRIFRTWETKNVITVLEDWENAELQNITEEGPIQTANGVFIVNSEQTSETYNESIVALNIAQSPMSMVAVNITYPKENNDTTITENIVGNNGNTAALNNLANSQNEEIQVNQEGPPVLVPGLTSLSALQTEEAPLYQDDRSNTMDSSGGLDEAAISNVSEFNEEQQEPDSDPHKNVMKMMFKGKELHYSELQQNHYLVKVKKQWRSDMQWGRATLQKLLSKLLST